MSFDQLAVIDCPVGVCTASWGFTPADPRRYWTGRNATHNKIIDHVVKDHPDGVVQVMAQIAIHEERWWCLEQVDMT